MTPEGGNAWIGTFAFGGTGFSRVLSMPNPALLCVIARGAGYIVSAHRPDAWEGVNAEPITDGRPIPKADIVVFASYTELVAYGERGMRWRTKRLAWDGLDLIEVGDWALVGEYRDLDDRMRRFEVDLLTGAACGGVET